MTTAEKGLAQAGPVTPARGHGDRFARDERRLVIAAFVGSLCAFLPTAAIATLVAGRRGLLGAFVGTGLVLVLFGAGAAMMLWAGRRGPSMMTLVAAGGVAARLLLYAAVLTALDGTDMVHRPSVAAATAVTLIITLAGEIAVLARTPSLFRLDVPDTAPSARPRDHDADRSTTL